MASKRKMGSKFSAKVGELMQARGGFERRAKYMTRRTKMLGLNQMGKARRMARRPSGH